MAAASPKKIWHGQAPAAATTEYTVPGSTTTVIRHIRVVNKDTTASYDLEMWVNGSTDADAIIAKKTIPAGGEWENDVYIVMATGDTLKVKASTAAKLTCYVSGAEIA